MAKRIGVGFVGAGWMGGVQLKRLGERDDVEVLALVEPNAERGRAALAAAGLPTDRLVADYAAIIANPAIDAVWLVSPNSFHGAQAIAALEAGKHVFCEKPAATRFGEFRREMDLARARPDLITFVDYILHFDTFEQRLRRLVEEGAFGQLTQVQVNYRHPVNIVGDKTWKLGHTVGGDAVGMGIIHSLYVIVSIMQPQARPVGVFATSTPARVRPFEDDPIWNILVRFDNGATGFCFGNIDSANGYDAYHSVYGSKGALIFDSLADRPQKVRMWSEGQAGGKWFYPLDPDRCRRDGAADLAWPADTTTPDSGDVVHHQTAECVGHFIECVKAGRPSPLGFIESAPVAEVAWAALQSAASGKEVKLPLDYDAAEKFFSE